MQKSPPTPKGFRDIPPGIAKKRRSVINRIADVLEKNSFLPLETPTVEFADTLKGKYGDEERLIYEFTDRGGRKLALRYDLTVPLARYIAANPNLPLPFYRYQIGQVFRGENPQHGRYREFTQFDFDTVGSDNSEEDAKIISCAIEATRQVGLLNAKMAVNDRKNFQSIPLEAVRVIDKIHKVQVKGVEKELAEKGFTKQQIDEFIQVINTTKPTEDLKVIFQMLTDKYGLVEDKDFFFDSTLARGLDYYTGSIFELKPQGDHKDLSIGSGGRYDNLIGIFANRKIPAVGFSFGVDRMIDFIK